MTGLEKEFWDRFYVLAHEKAASCPAAQKKFFQMHPGFAGTRN
jgi:hypothetical protein